MRPPPPSTPPPLSVRPPPEPDAPSFCPPDFFHAVACFRACLVAIASESAPCENSLMCWPSFWYGQAEPFGHGFRPPLRGMTLALLCRLRVTLLHQGWRRYYLSMHCGGRLTSRFGPRCRAAWSLACR